MTQALIPLYCLTGFVGSGKTTVLLSILKQYPQKKDRCHLYRTCSLH